MAATETTEADQQMLADITAGLKASGDQADIPRAFMVLFREIEQLRARVAELEEAMQDRDRND